MAANNSRLAFNVVTTITRSKASLAMPSEQHVGKHLAESKEVMERWPEYCRVIELRVGYRSQHGAQEENEEPGASILGEEVDVTVRGL